MLLERRGVSPPPLSGVSGGTADPYAAAGAAHNGVSTRVCQRIAKSPSNSAPQSALKYPLCASRRCAPSHIGTHERGPLASSSKAACIAGRITGGTGKFATIQGFVREVVKIDGGLNENRTDIEYSITK